jgi:hypothetical protein
MAGANYANTFGLLNLASNHATCKVLHTCPACSKPDLATPRRLNILAALLTVIAP